MPEAIPRRGLRISIDRGGTFTDCVCKVPDGKDIVIKILSVDPSNYDDAPTEAIRRVLEIYTGTKISRKGAVDLSPIEWVRMGTTVATNALLERKGEKTALLITKGFKDLLTIGNQSRPSMFSLAIDRPSSLFCCVEEISERVVVDSCPESHLGGKKFESPRSLKTVSTASGESVDIISPLDIDEVEKSLKRIKSAGISSLAICLMHSYIFPDHELKIREIAERLGFDKVCLSSSVSSRSKIVPRGNSTVIDAYLTPVINRYLSQFSASFPELEESGVRLDFMQSDGGLVPSTRLSGLKAILSGPAGGVVGYAKTCYDPEDGKATVGFDMGGTSTDVSRYSGQFEHLFESNTAGILVQAPQLDIDTIAAGGGSILAWKDGLFTVGPESASSHPGPACYRKGGPLTVTDANLALGRLVPDQFPSIFGPNENEPLDAYIVEERFIMLSKIINEESGQSLTWREVAAGFIEVANNAMSGPIRTLTEARGYDTTAHNLASFGGAGGQHACEIARILGIKRVLIHKYSSVLSAHGIGLADIVEDGEEAYLRRYDAQSVHSLEEDLARLATKTEDAIISDGFYGPIESTNYLSMRYDGSDTVIVVPVESGKDTLKTFVDTHQQEFGYTPERDVFIDQIRVRSVGKSNTESGGSWPRELASYSKLDTTNEPALWRSVFFPSRGYIEVPIYKLGTLTVGSRVSGPCLIVDETQTVVVIPGAVASILKSLIVIDLPEPERKNVSSSVIDPVQLSVFKHRFFGVAEQMGRTLQKVSISANIKERLDFSCAIFTAEGDLVANAPHVPAMIGSMAFAVKSQVKHWRGRLSDGDVLLSNSPVFGGVHLPDMTIITPVFDSGGSEIIFWAASRGHHADVGGIAPGSMPPSSTELWEEGAVFSSFRLIHQGRLDEEGLRKILLDDPAMNPGCSGSRCYKDNVADLKAQVAANHCGIRLIRQMISEYTTEVVHMYMTAIQDAAELSIRNLFKKIAQGESSRTVSATDYMDDSTAVVLNVKINGKNGSAIFDFSGTGSEVLGNWNAPIAITTSAIIYALRCMVNSDIPLNHGCIKPIDIVIPEGSFLNPSAGAAVCAGNVLTSQRIVDVIFRAFETCAASQGCMNNFTFGVDGEGGFGYYETICGGSGAGPTWHGTSGVHTNMTNTRITDPESLERRYPVILREFSLRSGSGGRGEFNGGDGVIRDVEFRIPMTASILSERRAFRPYGLKGGEDGGRGVNTWIRSDGRRINVGGKGSAQVNPGDRFVIQSPGGGAYGAINEGQSTLTSSLATRIIAPIAGGSVNLARALGEQN
ncbi:putative 5-oxoprolinase, partial [Aureobasidium melanogenum]|uniref:Putative 5-oxoprolinase n=1 Tax=Aureobasidium melanogenum (strain CBS 110374) TaxID=1043003 RepID=A0A074VRH6_AURM1